MWQPQHVVPKTTGMCSTGACTSRQETTNSFHNRNTKISLPDAQKICHLHYDLYLAQLSQRRMAQQRSARYNGTIQAVFDQCVFDVTTTGLASVSLLQIR